MQVTASTIYIKPQITIVYSFTIMHKAANIW